MNAATEAIAAYGLPSEHDLRLTPLEPGDEFSSVIAACEQHRLLGFLARATRDGAVVLTDDQRDDVELMFRSWLTHALRAERVLIDATIVLDRAGIDSRVLKGPALAPTPYTN